MTLAVNRRILTVDDTPSIHEDYRKILGAATDDGAQQKSLAAARAAFFGKAVTETVSRERQGSTYTIDSALQGEEALALVQKSIAKDQRYALAFVDIRMPPGWDGVKTIQELWKVDPDLQCVICTAFSDYSWEQTIDALGRSDKLLILKKPFDPAEIRQLAMALTEKWNSHERELHARRAIEAKEAEARAYAASLETANQALRTSKASADRAAALKRTFLERLTHDMSTSLESILGGLSRSGQTDGLEETLDRSQQLLETITRALDLTRLEQGTLGLSPGPCDLPGLLAQVAGKVRPFAESRGLEFQLQTGPDLPSRIELDSARLAQVLEQLLSNAVRFTERGFVRLSVRTEPTADWSTVRLRFDVSDTGSGVHPEDKGRLFEPFQARPRGRDEGGSGLGLAVAKQVARLLGGDLSFEARPEGGSVFSLALDVKRA